MKALILAAGLGSRLKGYTNQIPKALVSINNKPILAYQIDALISNNIDEIYIVIGYKGEKIIYYTKINYSHLNITFIKNKEYDSSNSSYSFWLAHQYILDSPYVHLNCDIIISSMTIKRILTSEFDNVISMRTDHSLTDNMELVQLDNNKKIIKMNNEYFPEAIGKAYGIAKFSAESTNLLLNKLDKYLKLQDKNQNYYGLIRESVSELGYYVIECNDDILFEANTIVELKDVEKRIIEYGKI